MICRGSTEGASESLRWTPPLPLNWDEAWSASPASDILPSGENVPRPRFTYRLSRDLHQASYCSNAGTCGAGNNKERRKGAESGRRDE